METAYVYLNFIRADGVADEVALELTSKGELIGEALNLNETVENVLTELDIYDLIEFLGGGQTDEWDY